VEPYVFERGDKIFLVAPVTPISLDEGQFDELAFAQKIKQVAPNPSLMWLQGRYVEADNANANRQMWRADDLAIKSLQPVFMPVTVMHDPRTAVGLIADARLLTPEAASVPRARIDTMLGIWEHRFPEVAEEINANYEAGSLMQSMECTSPHYECSVCSQLFHKLPDGAERSQWCEHLRGNGSVEAARILGGVVFTGTGLIFGTRGSRGAYDKAHLDVFEDEVAEYHERTHQDQGKPRRKTSMDQIEIPKTEYAELQKRPSVEEMAAEKKRADEAIERAEKAERDLERVETEKKGSDERLAEATRKVEEAEETTRKNELRDERLGALGEGFMEKLGDTAKKRLRDQAGEFSDDDWRGRLEELSEMVGVKPDADKDGKPGGDGKKPGGGEFSKEEIAAAQAGNGNGDGGGKPKSQRSVIGALMGSDKTTD
jgi:hypothetical protein